MALREFYQHATRPNEVADHLGMALPARVLVMAKYARGLYEPAWTATDISEHEEKKSKQPRNVGIAMRHLLQSHLSTLPAGSTVADFGAGSGYYLQADMFPPNARVFAIEPHRESVERGIANKNYPSDTVIVAREKPPYLEMHGSALDLLLGITSFHTPTAPEMQEILSELSAQHMHKGSRIFLPQDMAPGIRYFQNLPMRRLNEMVLIMANKYGQSTLRVGNLEQNAGIFGLQRQSQAEIIRKSQTLYSEKQQSIEHMQVNFDEVGMPLLSYPDSVLQTSNTVMADILAAYKKSGHPRLQFPNTTILEQELNSSKTHDGFDFLTNLYKTGIFLGSVPTDKLENRNAFRLWIQAVQRSLVGIMHDFYEAYQMSVLNEQRFEAHAGNVNYVRVGEDMGLSGRTYYIDGMHDQWTFGRQDSLVSIRYVEAVKI